MDTRDDRSPRSDLEVSGLSVRYPRAAQPVLRDAALKVGQGQSAGLLGRSGAGKTTFLHAVAGLVPWLTSAAVEGRVAVGGEAVEELDPGQRAHLLATCLDRPDAQLFLATVAQEIEAARRLYGDGPLVGATVEGLGLGPLLDRRVTELSSGERQRVALAVALAACPRPVLLDEPTAHLDAGGERAVVELLRFAAAAGAAVVLTEQAGWRLGAGVASWFEVAGGRVSRTGVPLPPVVPAPGHAPGATVVLRGRGLSVSRGGRRLVSGAELDLREGEIVLLSGPNGAGKSTLAKVLAGLTAPAAGEVVRIGRAALVFPEAELQLFASTVAAEVAAAGTSQEERSRVLRRHRLDHLAARAPWTLSRGERQRLVHAALDLGRPAVMIVDEPGQGLDPADLLDLVSLVHRRAAKGRAYLLISHRPELAAAVHRRLVLDNGRLEEVGP